MQNLQKEYERIKKYAVENRDMGNYAITSVDMDALLTCSPDTYNALYLAFKFGFAKGCRKTKKAVKSND